MNSVMNTLALLPVLTENKVPAGPPASTGEIVAFWILAPLMVLCAIGVVVSRKAVHAAVSMVGMMIGLACIYMSLGAQFLGVVQIVVYTGAIMMLILFVIMMLGVTASDKYRSTSAKLRVGAWVMGIVTAAGLITILVYTKGYLDKMGVGTVSDGVASDPNPVAIAKSLFVEHYFTIELVAALLIVAAIGAMTLTHPDQLRKKFTQREVADHKMEVYGTHQIHPGQLPQPGVYATTNAVDVPTLSGETGKPIPESVPRVVRIKGLDRSLGEVAPLAANELQSHERGLSLGFYGAEASRSVGRSGQWGMAGEAADTSLRQVTKEVAVAEPDDNAAEGKEESK